MFEATLFTTILVLATSATYFCRICFRQRQDLTILRDAIRATSRKGPLPKTLYSLTPDGNGLWHSIGTLIQSLRSVDYGKATYQRAIQLGAQIVGASDQVQKAAEEVTQVILAQAPADIKAVSLVLFNPETSRPYIEHLTGLPYHRIGETILACFDALLDEPKESKAWGYHIVESKNNPQLAMSNIGMTLTLPLSHKGEIYGGIWVGFRQGSLSLSPHRLQLIRGLVEHAAASLSTAERVRETVESSQKERDFLIGVSHDLRAPGTSALYVLKDMLASETERVSEKTRDKLLLVEQALEEQLSALGDVLDFTKHQRGFIDPRKQWGELKTFLQNPIAMHAPLAQAKGLAYVVQPTPDILIQFDSNHIKRALSNLLSNAIKYTREGGISIHFQQRNDCFEIIVSDTGIGIPEDQQKELFSKFKRMRNANGQKGIGLGLALSKALVELNSGTLSFESRPEGGSIFRIQIPTSQVRLNERQETLQKKADIILVVDDDEAVCRTNMRYLRHLAKTVVPANSPSDALALSKSLLPDVIVTDLYFEEKRGESLLEDLAKEGLSIPTVVVTGSGNQAELKTLREKYHVEILEKPIHPEVLCETIEQIML